VTAYSNLTAHNSTLAQRQTVFAPYFAHAEEQLGIPAGLLLQQGIAESRLDPSASSSAGAVGIMQLEPNSFPDRQVGVDPLADINTAAEYLSQQFARFGSWGLALAAYNAGPGNVEKYGNQVPPFDETRGYVQKIASAAGLDISGVQFA